MKAEIAKELVGNGKLDQNQIRWLSPSKTRRIPPKLLLSSANLLERLERIVSNSMTHGIEVKRHEIQHPITEEYFKAKPNGNEMKLELSVWDFAGQHDYYNNHHYFLQARTVFLVLWNLSQGEGMKGLEFWLRSLAMHLPKDAKDPTGKSYFSVFIVGTHFD